MHEIRSRIAIKKKKKRKKKKRKKAKKRKEKQNKNKKNWSLPSIRERHFATPPTGFASFLAKRRLIACHYPDLGSASDKLVASRNVGFSLRLGFAVCVFCFYLSLGSCRLPIRLRTVNQFACLAFPRGDRKVLYQPVPFFDNMFWSTKSPEYYLFLSPARFSSVDRDAAWFLKAVEGMTMVTAQSKASVTVVEIWT